MSGGAPPPLLPVLPLLPLVPEFEVLRLVRGPLFEALTDTLENSELTVDETTLGSAVASGTTRTVGRASFAR